MRRLSIVLLLVLPASYGQIFCDAISESWHTNEISASGNILVSGDPGASNLGRVQTRIWDGSAWTDMPDLWAFDGQPGDKFGYSVCVSGNRLIVGAPYDDFLTTDSGSAYIYFWTGSEWIIWQKIVPPDPQWSASFGTSVAIAGDFALVGEPHYDIGTEEGMVHSYHLEGGSWVLVDSVPGPASYHRLGMFVAIDPPHALMSGDRSAKFRYWNGSGWDDLLYLSNVHGRVAVSGDWATLSIRLYHFDGSTWNQVYVEPQSSSELDLHNGILVSGHSRTDHGGVVDSGSVWIYSYGPDPNEVNFVKEFVARDKTPGASLGTRVALGDGFVAAWASVNRLYTITDMNPPCPGDLDGNRLVDLTDLTILLQSFQGSDVASPGGDIDCDNDTDFDDLTLLLQQFDNVCP